MECLIYMQQGDDEMNYQYNQLAGKEKVNYNANILEKIKKKIKNKKKNE